MPYDYQGNEVNLPGGIDYEAGVLPQYDNLVSILEMEQRTGYIRWDETHAWWDYLNGSYKYAVIPVSGGESISGEGNGTNGGRIHILADYRTPTASGDPVTYATGFFGATTYFRIAEINNVILPDDARYIIVQTNNNGTDVSPLSLKIGNKEYAKNVRAEVAALHYGNGVNWVQFGDSITAGYYSFFDPNTGTADSRASGQNVVYPWLVHNRNGWGYTNMGVGGMGWIETSIVGNYNSVAWNQVKKITNWSGINLVTFAYGVNDYKADADVLGALSDAYTYSEGMTPTTVVNSMRYCFDYVMSKKPGIKIIVITPFNCRGYQYNFGSAATCWARGYTHPHGGHTLDEVAATMKAVCAEYGVECLDMTTDSCINKGNIVQMLPDGVHPSIECHELLSREIAKKLSFC